MNKVPPAIPWPSNLHIAGTVNVDESTYPISDKVLDRAFTIEFWDVDLPRFFERSDPQFRAADVETVLLALYDILRPVRRQFGYRVAGEVQRFVTALRAGDPTAPPSRALDHGVFSKVLPRLRGEDSPALRHAFADVAALAQRYGLVRCAEKIAQMDAMLRQSGTTRFWA